ncbi:AzlD domain-containing protein, partial [Burkholderia pseudomallei]
MSDWQVWLAIAGMTLVTAITRALFLAGGERTVLPERAQRSL